MSYYYSPENYSLQFHFLFLAKISADQDYKKDQSGCHILSENDMDYKVKIKPQSI